MPSLPLLPPDPGALVAIEHYLTAAAQN